MKLITINTMEIIAELLCYMQAIQTVSKPTFDYGTGTIKFVIQADRGAYEYELNMVDVIKLHDYKITQFAYSLVQEYYEERSNYR